VLQLLEVNGGWLLRACHGVDFDDVAELESATTRAEAVLRGPRGGMGLSRGIDWATARPHQASTASEHNALVNIRVLDFILEVPFWLDARFRGIDIFFFRILTEA
jgi:hypothetical protein